MRPIDREGGDGSAQRGRFLYDIYDCLVGYTCQTANSLQGWSAWLQGPTRATIPSGLPLPSSASHSHATLDAK